MSPPALLLRASATRPCQQVHRGTAGSPADCCGRDGMSRCLWAEYRRHCGVLGCLLTAAARRNPAGRGHRPSDHPGAGPPGKEVRRERAADHRQRMAGLALAGRAPRGSGALGQHRAQTSSPTGRG